MRPTESLTAALNAFDHPDEAHMWTAINGLTEHMSPDDLAAELEHLEADRKMFSTLAGRASQVRAHLTQLLVDALGEGEVVQAPSGRLAFRAQVSDGTAKVNTDALNEHIGELPDELKPKPTIQYPGVTAIRAAVKQKLIDRKLAKALITEPPKVPGLRWRTLETTTEED